ncbi:MAG: hypothetical protein ACREQ2_15535 [Candidatus Binatia bacterium]
MQREKVSPDRLVEYAIRLNIGAVIRRLGYLLDLYELGTDKTAKALTNRLTNTYVPLDPVLPTRESTSTGKELRDPIGHDLFELLAGDRLEAA